MTTIERLLGAVYSGSSSKSYSVKTYVPPTYSTTYVSGGYRPGYYGSNTIIVGGGGYYYAPVYYSYGGGVVVYNRNPAGAIIGAVVGGLVFLIILILVICFCCGCCCFRNCRVKDDDSSIEIIEVQNPGYTQTVTVVEHNNINVPPQTGLPDGGYAANMN